MKSAGYTLVELLVVISIMSMLAVVGFVNFRGISSDQVTIKAVGQIQTLLRLAQSNATSGTLCGSSGGVPWSLVFNSGNVGLACGSPSTIQKTYILENAQIYSLISSNSCTVNLATTQFYVAYSTGVGILTVSYSGATDNCKASDNWTFTIRNAQDTTKTKTLILSKGGTINVQ